MFHYLTLGAHDMKASSAFYDRVLATIGFERLVTDEKDCAYGPKGGPSVLWIVRPENKLPASYGNGTMLALTAPSRKAVDDFHATALASGGYDEGKPGLRSYGPNWYACYVRDPTGNKLSAVYDEPA
jgi:predicted lactoylglutathione lyase